MKTCRNFFDFETYSEVDLADVGISAYVNHPSTDVICLAYGELEAVLAGEEPFLWTPGFDDTIPSWILGRILNNEEFHAFNAGFERLAWAALMVRKYGWKAIPDHLWRDTQAKSSYCNFPRKLQKISDLLQLGERGKDKEGHKAMLKITKPNNKGVRNFDPALYAKTYAYCKRDIICEAAIDSYCPDLPSDELKIWFLDQKINARGVPIDLDMCRGAVKIALEQARRDNVRLHEITAGKVNAVTETKRIKEFVMGRGLLLPTDGTKDKKGNIKYSMDKRLLAEHEFAPDADPVALEVMAIRTAGAKASCAKYQAALDWTDPDGRCRQTLKYFTAGPGRWSGAGPQFQNMTRPDPDYPATDEVIAKITAGDIDAFGTDNAVATLAYACRSMICAPDGYELCISDFSNIEKRVLDWISGNRRGLDLLEAGADVYKDMASKIYGIPVEKIEKKSKERFVGKEATLGWGYGMGGLKFQKTVKQKTGIILSLADAKEVIDTCRSSTPEVPNLWRALERAALTCVQTGKHIHLKHVSFRMEGKFMCLRLPSGRDIYYYDPKIVRRDGKAIFSYINAAKGVRKEIWGGTFTENICQAISRDLMATAMVRIDNAGIYLFLTVHDETVSQIPLTLADEQAKLVHKLMETRPEWAKECPIAAETHVSKRFTK